MEFMTFSETASRWAPRPVWDRNHSVNDATDFSLLIIRKISKLHTSLTAEFVFLVFLTVNGILPEPTIVLVSLIARSFRMLGIR